jgi:integrase
MSAGRSPSVLTQDEAARVLQAALSHSAWDGLVVGLMLVTGWTVAEIAQAVRRLQAGGRS